MSTTAYAPFVLSASPRHGNSLEAVRQFCLGLAAAGGPQTSPERLARYNVRPCVACGVCDRAGTVCPQAAHDDSNALFRRLWQAPLLAISAPIYFYHLPAALKAAIDRCQFYYRAYERKEAPITALPRRKAFIMLLGAREQGDNLFTGSLLTLKLALKPFNFELAEPLLLRGLDAPNALAARPDMLEALRAYGTAAAKTAL